MNTLTECHATGQPTPVVLFFFVNCAPPTPEPEPAPLVKRPHDPPEFYLPARPPARQNADRLTPAARAVLQVLGEAGGRPAHAKKLARLAGYRYNSRFREVMTDLMRRGLVWRGPDGYLAHALREDTPRLYDEEA